MSYITVNFTIYITVYRASFRLTMAELTAPTGEWKSITAMILLGLSVTAMICVFLKKAGIF